MTLVAGVDSSTQSCKVVVRDAETGALVRSGRASHPDGTSVHPRHWWDALRTAVDDAGGLADVDAVSVGGQQHGMVALDADGEVVRDALLWNDTRSAGAAEDLVAELGAQEWADSVGSVLVASLTVTKLRWLRDAEPENAARTAAVALPHDWLTWQLAGGMAGVGFEGLVTDRSDVSGTGYWSPRTGDYRTDLVERALGHVPALPRVLGPSDRAGTGTADVLGGGSPALGPGAGDNAAAALALGLRTGDVAVSIGTSGVVSAIADAPTADGSGLVTGFADATGRFLPLACTLNAARILDWAARLLGVDHARLAELALSAPAGADGLVLVPYFEGERTPNLPHAAAALHGMRLTNTTPAHIARAAFEGLLCSLADGIDALRAAGVPVQRAHLVGGAAQSAAVQALAPDVLGLEVHVPTPGEYVADGAARQAAWVLAGGAEAPAWVPAQPPLVLNPGSAADGTRVREQYAAARGLVLGRG
ncbi:xylulokinase [Cellulomonas marina]|uniref:Xylulose kinase n=1 Tax=Cellulomonas marina TaxID=988821 RepID=A0A1I0WMW5_9CELL|nr:xylulokinase [Cellulomonas marina]GIG27761.1 xylulokinase [Cellulomonas marina]SFA90072.1 xylulokinase [Cellulomonas marina]